MRNPLPWLETMKLCDARSIYNSGQVLILNILEGGGGVGDKSRVFTLQAQKN